MGKIKSGFEGILEGKKRDIWCFRVSGLDTKKKTTKTTKTLKDTKDNTNAVFFRRHVVRVGARKRRRRRRRRRQVGGAFNNAFNARRSFSVAQQRLFRFGELERRRRRVEHMTHQYFAEERYLENWVPNDAEENLWDDDDAEGRGRAQQQRQQRGII